MENEFPRGQLNPTILSTMTSGDKYGYEIIDEIKAITQPTNDFIIIKPTTVVEEKTLTIRKAVATGIPFLVKNKRIKGGKICHQ